MSARPLPALEPDQTRMNAAAASALSMQEQAIQGGKKVIPACYESDWTWRKDESHHGRTHEVWDNPS